MVKHHYLSIYLFIHLQASPKGLENSQSKLHYEVQKKMNKHMRILLITTKHKNKQLNDKQAVETDRQTLYTTLSQLFIDSKIVTKVTLNSKLSCFS